MSDLFVGGGKGGGFLGPYAPGIVTTVAFRRLVLALLTPYLNGCVLRLFANDVHPSWNTVLSDLIEPSFPGYATLPLTGWGGPIVTSQNTAMIATLTRTFTMTSPGPASMIYGYFVTDPNGYLAFLERDPAAPVEVSSSNPSYAVLPRLFAGWLC